MDFKEVYFNKSGKRVIFTKFEEFLPEITGVKDIDEFKAIVKKSGTEYICHCPFCKAEGHKKHKLYIHEDLEKGNCFVCGRNFINIDDTVRVDYRIPEFLPMFSSALISVPKIIDSNFDMDAWNYEFESTDEVGEKYLASRHQYLPEIAKLLGFKYMNGNIVIPFRYNGEVVYYQIRFSSGKFRYLFPKVEAGQKMPYILDFGEGKKRLIICEGVFDAIALMIMAPEYLPIAVLGSDITDYQINYLREYLPEEIVIYMDETSISKRIKRRLKSTFSCPIRIIHSDGEDPEENLKKKISWGSNLQWITPQENKPGFHIPVNNYKII